MDVFSNKHNAVSIKQAAIRNFASLGSGFASDTASYAAPSAHKMTINTIVKE